MTNQATHVAIIIDAENGEPVLSHAIPGTSYAEAREFAIQTAGETMMDNQSAVVNEIIAGTLLIRVLPIDGRA